MIEITLNEFMNFVEVGSVGTIQHSNKKKLYHGELISHSFIRLFPDEYKNNLISGIAVNDYGEFVITIEEFMTKEI